MVAVDLVHKGAVAGLLAAGTLAALIGKGLYQIKARPAPHKAPKYFAKPLASTLAMFIGMFLCLPVWLAVKATRSLLRRGANTSGDSANEEQSQPLLRDHESTWSLESLTESTTAWWHHYAIILIPTIFDLTATILQSVGLLFTTASVYQMVRGSEIIFTAILSVVFLHRRLNKLNVAGLVLCLLGILTVAAATVLDARKAGAAANGGPTAGQTIVGMLLILLSELVQASQVVAEDYLMSSAPQKIHPVELVGYEGLFGAGVMLAVVLPLAQISRIGPEGGGLREDSLETLGMLRNSHQLLSLYGTYIAIMAVYNITGMQVTEAMGALSRVVAETVRTMLIWGGDLWLYYNFRTKTARIGEPWTQYSWIEAVGFLVLVVGTASYGIGEERHAEKVRECLKRKARERWAMVRASMKHLAALHQELTEEERRLPFMPSRIAGPARFRISLRTLASRHRGRQRAAQEGEGGQVAEAGASP